MLTPTDRKLLNNHVLEQKKLRKIEKPDKMTPESIDALKEDIFFFQMDFVKSNGYDTDRVKLTEVWKYLENALK